MERFFPTRAVHQREIHGSGNRCGSARRNSGGGNSCSFGIQSVLSMERLQIVSYFGRAMPWLEPATARPCPPMQKTLFCLQAAGDAAYFLQGAKWGFI